MDRTWFRSMTFVSVLAVAVFAAPTAWTQDIDVTPAGAAVQQDGAWYIQGPLPSSAGTGLIDPFLTDGGGGSQDITRSYNTDGTAEFDTVTGGDRTKALNLAAVPETEYNGQIYKEFVLDINKAPGGSPYLAMNELQLWLTADPNLSGYDLATYSFPSGATKIFDLDEGSQGDAAVLMDYSLESGSGASDLTWLVPLSVFGNDPDCTYGNTQCTQYVVLFNEYGNYTESGADPDKWTNNDGFEEWGTVLRPVVSVTKDATGTFDRTITWTLDKSVDVDSHSGSAGQDAGASTWTVVAGKTVTEGNIAASGTISILNPTGGAGNPIEESIDAVILSVEDVIDQGGSLTNATVDCGVTFPYTLNAGETLVCSYTASPATADPGVNEATATIEGLNDTTSVFSGSADLAFFANVIGFESGTLADPRFGYSQTISSGTTVTFPETFSCPSDVSLYENGSYSYEEINTATLNGNINLSASAQVDVTCTLQALVPSKTADATYDRTVTWTLEKSVTPASLSGNIGGAAGSSTWTVVADKTEVSDNYLISGTISIFNPTAISRTFSVSDELDDGTPVTVNCPSNTVAAGATVECTYSASPTDDSATLNTATVSATGNPDQTATAPVSFTENLIGEDSGTLADPRFEFSQEISGDTTQEFPEDFNCPADASLYTDGVYTFTETNIVTLNDNIDLSASAQVELTCYAPTVSKDAATSYTREFSWTIDKTVDDDSHTGFVGDMFSSGYTVEVVQTVDEYDFAVSGTITVVNPNPDAAMVVSVSDSVNGTAATLDCGGTLNVLAGSSADCGYSADLTDKVDGTNTATISIGGADFAASADYAFDEPTDTVGFETINVTDTQPDSTAPWQTSDDNSWIYDGNFECPTDESLYTDGVYTESIPNIATITETDQSADANVDVICYLPSKANVVKVTDPDPPSGVIGDAPFVFDLYYEYDPNNPPAGSLEQQSLNGPGTVEFATDLIEPGEWTIIETLPEGWVVEDENTLVCSFNVSYPADADGTFTCTFTNIEKGRVNLLKTNNGAVDPSMDFQFELFDGPNANAPDSSFLDNPLASDTTLNNNSGELTFGEYDLDPLAAYSICERDIPSGWDTVWMIDTDADGFVDAQVMPYNPNLFDPDPEDLGNRCIDVGAGTGYPIVRGGTLVLEVDNVPPPGGEARTPGYWKNWSTCSNGRQQYTADKNSEDLNGDGVIDGAERIAAGFPLIDDVLPQTLGNLVIDTCENAVLILDHREIDVNKPKKKASDGAYKLARALLAYKANIAAGAATCLEAETAAASADSLLADIGFDGNGNFLRPNHPRYQEAVNLAGTLDAYNNNMLCP